MRRQFIDSNSAEFTVLLNGKQLQDIIWADAENGEALIHQHEWALDQRGQRIQSDEGPEPYKTLLVRGEIEIIDRPSVEQFSFSYDFSNPTFDDMSC